MHCPDTSAAMTALVRCITLLTHLESWQGEICSVHFS